MILLGISMNDWTMNKYGLKVRSGESFYKYLLFLEIYDTSVSQPVGPGDLLVGRQSFLI